MLIGLRPQDGFCPGGKPPKRGGDEDEDDDDDDDDDDDGGQTIEQILDLVRPDDCLLGSEFAMSSDRVERLDGVIYFPVSHLIVEGKNPVAEGSDWTVMIVRSLEVRGSPTLVINADYSGAVVPVPAGVGTQGGVVRLVD